MPRSKDNNLLQCRECGSRNFAIHGPTIRNGIVQCAECRAVVGSLDEFMSIVEAHFQKLERGRRKHLH